MRELGLWNSRGYLPHYEDGSSVQAITYRLADSLPPQATAKLKEISTNDNEHRHQLEMYLNSGYGSCLLAEKENAEAIVSAWKFFHEKRYLLYAWVVMPNHVHVLIEPFAGYPVSVIVHSWKSYTSRRMSGISNPPTGKKTSRVWQPEYFDRFIRNESHYLSAVHYIHNNPVNAGLVNRDLDWPWSSVHEWKADSEGRSGSAGLSPAI